MLIRLFQAGCAAAILLAACDEATSPTSVGPATPIPPAPPATTPTAPVNIGFLVSGVRTYANGAMIAVDEANEGGGLLGRPISKSLDLNR